MPVSLKDTVTYLARPHSLPQGFPYFLFVAIGSSTVNVSVSRVQGAQHSLFDLGKEREYYTSQVVVRNALRRKKADSLNTAPPNMFTKFPVLAEYSAEL